MAMGVPRERLIERALALIVEGEVAPGEAAQNARAAMNQWRNRSPEHAAALLEARHRWDMLGGMAGDLRAHFDTPAAGMAAAAAATSARSPQRRKLLLSIVGLVGGGLVAGRGVQWYWQQPVFRSAYNTRTAQMLKVTLPDGAADASGSQLDIAPRSAIEVTLYRGQRIVDMARGEVRFEVAHDSQRPFRVRTRDAVIEVVGTVFTVRDRGGPVTVGVEQGHVRVQVRARQNAEASIPSSEVIDLHAGELVEVLDGHADAVRQSDTRALSAWRDGWLVFDNTPLSEALAAVNSYRIRPIVSADARIDALRLSGRFRTNDSVGLVEVLPTILPMVADSHPDGSVELRKR